MGSHWADLFPLVFFPFKIIVLGIGMYFAIKWHRDREKEEQAKAVNRKQAPDSPVSSEASDQS